LPLSTSPAAALVAAMSAPSAAPALQAANTCTAAAVPRDDRCAPNTVNECSDVASPAVSLPVPTLDGWLAGCGVDAVELPAKTKTEKKVVSLFFVSSCSLNSSLI
jgi:hypothetical protein